MNRNNPTPKSKSIFTLLFLFLLSCFSYSQAPLIYHYSSAEGLPSTECYSVIQDKKGNIWVATDRGISRFNGYEFVNYTTEDGLTDNTVFTMKEDYKGRIWFHGYNGKLCYFYEDKIHSYKYNEVITNAFSGGRIGRSLYIGTDDNVSIGFMDHGLITISSEGKAAFPNVSHPTQAPSAFFGLEIDEQLYIGSHRTPKKKDSSIYPTFITNLVDDTLRIIPVRTVSKVLNNITGIKLKNGDYIFSTSKIAVKIGPEKEPVAAILDHEVVWLFEDSRNCLWTGTFNEGVRKYENHESFPKGRHDTFLQGLTVTSVFEDREGGFWFSTLQDGVFYMPCPSILNVYFGEKPDVIGVSSICNGPDSSVFIGTTRGAIYKYSLKDQRMKDLPQVQSKYGLVQSLLFDPIRSELYVGTAGSFGKLTKDEKYIHFNTSQTRAMSILKSGEIILTSSFGIMKINKDGTRDTLINLPLSFRIDVLHVDNTDKIWLGCIDGLYCIENRKLVKDTSSFLKVRIIDIKSLPDHSMVIATIGKGIVIKRGSQYRKIDEESGLSSNIVNSVSVGNQRILAATNKGVCEVDLYNNDFSFRTISKEHGLPTNELKEICALNDMVCIGTNTGVVFLKLGEVKRNKIPTVLSIEKINVNGAEIDTASREFSYNENFFEFRYTGYCFRKRGEINYRYRLLGLNDRWQETQNRNIQYTSLDPGTYRFELKAQNEEGIWTENPVVYEFKIALPYWKEPTFLIITALITFSLLFGFVWWRFSQIRIKNELMLQMNEFQRKALASQMNPHFIFNSLNSINSFIINEDRTKASKYLNRFAKLMRLCLNNSDKKYVSINDEYDLLKVYLELEELRFKNKFSSQINVESDLLNSTLKIPSMLLQPYIENAILHGLIPKEGDKGRIEISIGFKEKDLYCTIRDNGIGRKRASEKTKESSHKYESKGTIITAERMRVYTENVDFNYFLEIEDLYDNENNPAGTIVRFHLPYIKEQP